LIKFFLCFFICLFFIPAVLPGQVADTTLRLPSSTSVSPGTANAIKGIEGDLQKPFKTMSSSSLKSLFKLPIDTSRKKKKIEFHAKMFTDVSYSNIAGTPNQFNGFYSRIGIDPSIKILGIPFSGELSLNMQNSQVRFDYSTASVQFDMDQYKDQVKSQYLKYMSNIENFYSKDEAAQVTKIGDTMERMNLCQKMITSPNYEKTLTSLLSKARALEDSAKRAARVQAKDSCYERDSCDTKDYKTITDSIKKLENYAKDYKTAQQYINSHQNDLRKLEQYKNFLSTVKNSNDISQIPGVSKDLNSKNIIDQKLQIFSSIQKFGIGKVNLNYSQFTLSNQNVYGLDIEYLIKNLIYVGGGLGVPAAFNLGFTPQFFTQATNTIGKMNRFITFLRIGVGKVKGNHLHLIYFGYTQKFGAVSTYAPNMPPANSVLSLEFQQSILRDLKFSGEAAISNSSYENRVASFAPVGKDDSTKALVVNYALRAALDGQIKKTETNLGAKFELVSNNFSTIGNPFLMKAYMTTSINGKQTLFDKRVTATDVLTYSIIGLGQSGFTNSSMMNNLTVVVKPGAKMNFSCSYMYMKQLPMGENENPINFSTHSSNFIQQYMAKIKKVKLTTALTSVFNISKNQSAEFNSSNISFQNGLKETVLFPKGFSFVPGAGLMLNNAGLPTNNSLHPGYWVEAGNSFNIKGKVTMQYQGRYSVDQVYGNNLNISGSLTAKLYKNLAMNAKCQVTVYQGIGLIPSNQSLSFGGGLSYSF